MEIGATEKQTPYFYVSDGGVEESSGDGGPGTDDAPWLLSVDNATHELLKINTATGHSVSLCTLSNTMGSYPSTTFALDGTLYASNSVDNTLEIIDPCTCEVTAVGATGYGMLPGITAHGDDIEMLFGVSMDEDILLTLDRGSGQGTYVGDLGINFSMSGTTWIGEEGGGLFAINSVDDRLYSIDIDTGVASAIRMLNVNFIIVGIEWHSGNDVLYACTTASDSQTGISGGSILYNIDRSTGTGTAIGVLPYSCNNLAAPWLPVPCVEEVPYSE